MHALVKDGAILELRDYEPIGDQSQLAAGKPRQLPIEVVRPEFNPVSHVIEGPEYTFEATRVVEAYTVRAKNGDEVAAMIAAKQAQIDAEFQRRCALPIEFAVGGETYRWHADAEARENILGVVLLIATGVPVPNPRPWTPVGYLTSVDVSHAELIMLGATIAGRKDALFVIKKAMQAAVDVMTDPLQIAAVDVAEGWE